LSGSLAINGIAAFGNFPLLDYTIDISSSLSQIQLSSLKEKSHHPYAEPIGPSKTRLSFVLIFPKTKCQVELQISAPHLAKIKRRV
jgi:hypothetical protein